MLLTGKPPKSKHNVYIKIKSIFLFDCCNVDFSNINVGCPRGINRNEIKQFFFFRLIYYGRDHEFLTLAKPKLVILCQSLQYISN